MTPRAEEELLLCCARKQLDKETAKRLDELLQKDMEWSYPVRLVRDHRITPLLYSHLDAADNRAVPRYVINELQEDFEFNYK